MKFTATVFSSVREFGPKATREWIASEVEGNNLDPEHYRITQALSQVADAEDQLENFSKRVTDDPELKIVSTPPASPPQIDHIPEELRGVLTEGAYTSTEKSKSFFDDVLQTPHLPSRIVQEFESTEFSLPAPTESRDTIFIAKDAQVSASSWSYGTVVNGKGEFYPSRSGRVSRLTGKALLRNSNSSEDEALILPFSYAPQNYYHSLSEMAYGLRFAHQTRPDCPIIFDVDKYEILKALCSTLGIDARRLVPRSEVERTKFKTAFLPDAAPYYWDQNFRSFFRSVSDTIRSFSSPKHEKIYISRANSARSFAGEEQLERTLSHRGFTIIYAEDYSVHEQIEIFSNCQILVAPHGAGLANTVFLPENAIIIELFNRSFINRDFMMRSRNITKNYGPVLIDSDIKETIHSIYSWLGWFRDHDKH